MKDFSEDGLFLAQRNLKIIEFCSVAHYVGKILSGKYRLGQYFKPITPYGYSYFSHQPHPGGSEIFTSYKRTPQPKFIPTYLFISYLYRN